MSLVDEAILTTFPLLPVPASGEPSAATDRGTRYLVARDGLWREINLPWIRLVHHVGPCVVQLPYGQTEPVIEFKCGPVPLDLIRSFGDEARARAPLEVAAALIWNEVSGDWRLGWRNAREASASHLVYDEVKLEDGEHLVVDVHSHGYHHAFFSQEDDRDDYGSMKVSLVVGSCNQPTRTSRMRLCMAGFVAAARLGEDGSLEVFA